MPTPTPYDSKDPESGTGARRRRCLNWRTVGRNKGRKVQTHTQKQSEADAAEYGDPSAIYWKLYGSEAEISDRKLVETLAGDTESMLLLNSIFSAVIASFIVETYKVLQPDNGQQTVCLLSQLVPGNSPQQSSSFCPGPYRGAPSAAAIRSNILLLLSFFLAIMSALACTLIQQWCREFTKHASPRAAPHKRGRVRTYLFQGLEVFYMRRFMYGVHVLLHTSVFLFFCGVSDYLHDVYPRVGMISWYCVTTLAVVYAALSIAPLIIGNCPYQTALTPPLQFGYRLLFFPGRVVWWCFWDGKKDNFPGHKDLHFNKSHYLVEEANKAQNAAYLDPYAMQWLFTDNDFSDTNMDTFLEGLPGYIHSSFTVKDGMQKIQTAQYILRRIREHLLTCATATDLSEQARAKRVSACVDSLQVILQYETSAERPENSLEEGLLRVYMQSIVDGLNKLCEESNKILGLRGSCVRALAFQCFLTKCLEKARGPERSPNVEFPDHFIPLYTFLASSPSQTMPQDTVPPRGGPDTETDKMWQAVLYDGPLINLTLLARAILSQSDVRVDPSTLSMCWKTLDALRSELRVTRVDVSDSSLARFNDVHKETLKRIEDEAKEPGFSLAPLLEVLDAVAGGRRLSKVFQDHPQYRNRADLVFGRDHLRNPDLFRAFAICLPDFVTKHPEESVGLMEGLVCYDNLWTSLQVHLQNSLRSNTLAPDKLRVFERCCIVIDAAFMALEDSQIVDWQAPDLGSLSHYFELFVTDCFEGMFVERAIGFRVGLIKARFCKAVLAQYLNEFDHGGTVVFRSHRDVASLARVFYSLGVGNDADVEFWKSFVDGGRIGAEFMAKTHAMLATAARDGPLLNFCKLGHLGMMTVPFKESGLEDTDFKKLLNLLQKMMEDPRLTLASTPVWEDLRRLRDEVNDTRATCSIEDATHMWDLLAKINAVYNRRPLSTQEIQEDDSREITPAPSNNSRGEFPNLYRNAYPILPSQIRPSGAIAHPLLASFLLSLFSHLENADLTSPGIPSAYTPSPYMRHNDQHRHASVYYPPKGGTARRSATLSSLQSPTRAPTRAHSAPSNILFDPSSNGVYSSSPPASSVELHS